MSEKCFCHLNGYAVKDATARNNIATIEERIDNLENITLDNEEVAQIKDNQKTLSSLMYNITGTKLPAFEQRITNLENNSSGGGTVNIKAGEGEDSVIQVYSGEVDGTHYESTSTGESAAVFGEANKNTANRALMSGKLNENSGANAIVGGMYNNTKANSGFTVGYGNTNNGENSIVGGLTNKNDGALNVVGGALNEITGESSIIGGRENTVTQSNTLVNGLQNVISVQNGTALGIGLIVSGIKGKVVIGKYNANKPNTIFEIGIGTSNTDRRNAFEVYSDGTCSAIEWGTI